MTTARRVSTPRPVVSTRLSDRQTADLMRRLASLMQSGIPATEALARIGRRRRGRIAVVVGQLEQGVREGATVAESMRTLPRVFSRLNLAMCQAGESAGRLPEALADGARLLEERMRRRLAFQVSLIYPAIVLTLGVALTTFLMLVVLPSFIEMFDEFDAELPRITRALISTSQAVTHYGPVVALAGIVAIVLGRFFARTRHGHVLMDWMALKMPLSSTLTRRAVTGRFARVYAQLLECGVPIAAAVRLAGEATGNLIAEQVMIGAVETVEAGRPLSSALVDDRIYLPSLHDELETGEASGQTDELLVTLADRIDAELKQIMVALTVLPGILILLFLGVFVGWIVLALMIPWFMLPGLV
jgi:type II secretory pathway component PulF